MSMINNVLVAGRIVKEPFESVIIDGEQYVAVEIEPILSPSDSNRKASEREFMVQIPVTATHIIPNLKMGQHIAAKGRIVSGSYTRIEGIATREIFILSEHITFMGES